MIAAASVSPEKKCMASLNSPMTDGTKRRKCISFANRMSGGMSRKTMRMMRQSKMDVEKMIF